MGCYRIVVLRTFGFLLFLVCWCVGLFVVLLFFVVLFVFNAFGVCFYWFCDVPCEL